MRKILLGLPLIFSLSTLAQTVTKQYLSPSGKTETIELREDAINWVQENVQGLVLLSEQKKLGVEYIATVFMDRLLAIDSLRPSYDEIYRLMTPESTSYSPFFVKEGLKIVILDKKQRVTDYPEYAHWRGKTVEEVFGYPGDLRLMDDIEGEATRNTCLLKEHRVGSFPKGSSNTFYHEFGHLIHMTTLLPHEFWAVEKLYLNAKARNVFIDDYAAQSVHEYFAQGLEAYLAEKKTAQDRRGKYTRTDRNDLKRIDVDLHDFIKDLVQNSTI